MNLDAIEPYLGWILGLVAAVATPLGYWIYRKTRTEIRLSYSFDSPYWLIPPDRLSQSGDAWSRVKVMYDDRVVNNVYILRVKIRNTGTVPIKSETMHKNFRFWFSAGTQLLAPAVIPQPVGTDDISVNLVEYNDGAISSCEVAFDLLNAKEEIDLQFVCAGTLSTPTVTGKIIGGTIREEFSQRLQRDMMEISKRTLYELASTLPLSRFFMFILDRVTHSWK